jgi:gluconate 2-dehydrogenase alpha chain
MSSTINHPQTDVVVCGLGHMGGPVAAELTTAGYQVVGIEKAPSGNTPLTGDKIKKTTNGQSLWKESLTIRFTFLHSQ